MRIRNELLKWLEEEKASALETCRQYRKEKEVNGALIAGTEASALARIIKKTKQIFNFSVNAPVSRSKNGGDNLKAFHIKTTTQGSYLNFFTEAENHHQALDNLIDNSFDFGGSKNSDMTIEIKMIKDKK